MLRAQSWGDMLALPEPSVGWVFVCLPVAFRRAEQGAESQGGRAECVLAAWGAGQGCSSMRARDGVPSAVSVWWPMDGAGEPQLCLPARRPRCRGAAQPVPTSVL